MGLKKLVGFYRELPHGKPTGPSLRDSVGGTPHPDRERILAYLSGAPVLIVTMGPGRDVLSPDQKMITPPHIMTDGLYFWPLDLAYYVGEYHAALPLEFMERMRSRDWSPPNSKDIVLERPSPEECEVI